MGANVLIRPSFADILMASSFGTVVGLDDAKLTGGAPMPEQVYLTRRAQKNNHTCKFPDLTGTVFGKLTVIGLSPNRGVDGYQRYWECLCSCGQIKTCRESHLKSGKIVTCGLKSIVHAAENFWPKVNKSDGCWVWTARLNNMGYGKCSEGLAHRFSWVLHNGPIPSGLQILHKCDNPPCVRPDHLFLGTQRDNIMDALGKGRIVVPKAQSVGEDNPSARLSAEDAMHIRSSVEKTRLLASRFGVTADHIRAIRRGRAWKHI